MGRVSASSCDDTRGRCVVDPAAPTILYVNGIRNDEQAVQDSSHELRRLLVSRGLKTSDLNQDYFWNETDFLGLGDVYEVLLQATLSDEALKANPLSRMAYYAALGSRYAAMSSNPELLSDNVTKRVARVTKLLSERIEAILQVSRFLVVVPHSQGNMYVEAAYAMLVHQKKTQVLERIRVVGVASAAWTSPNDKYLTHKDDLVINNLLGSFAALRLSTVPLPANATACATQPHIYTGVPTLACGTSIQWLEFDIKAHNFVSVYANTSLTDKSSGESLPDKIYQLVRDSLSADPLPPPSFPTTCKGQSTVMGAWTRFGTATRNTTNGIYSVGDTVIQDPNDLDNDCNQVASWSPGTNNLDSDWLIYNRSTTRDIDFSAEACLSHPSSSTHSIGLFKVDPLFTGSPKSGHNPVSGGVIHFSTQWNLSGRLYVAATGVAGPIFVPDAVMTPKGFCGIFRLTRVGNQHRAYYNNNLIVSVTGDAGDIVPAVIAFDNVIEMKPTVLFPN